MITAAITAPMINVLAIDNLKNGRVYVTGYVLRFDIEIDIRYIQTLPDDGF